MVHIHNEVLPSHTLNEIMQQLRGTEDSSVKSARHGQASGASSPSHVQCQTVDIVEFERKAVNIEGRGE